MKFLAVTALLLASTAFAEQKVTIQGQVVRTKKCMFAVSGRNVDTDNQVLVCIQLSKNLKYTNGATKAAFNDKGFYYFVGIVYGENDSNMVVSQVAGM